MKIAIIGSRDFTDYHTVCETLKLYSTKIKCIVSGGARGVDMLAERYAIENNIDIKIFPAEWDKYGKSAGYRRNIDIVNYADVIIAFWDGSSKGTKHGIDIAKKKNKPVRIEMI